MFCFDFDEAALAAVTALLAAACAVDVSDSGTAGDQAQLGELQPEAAFCFTDLMCHSGVQASNAEPSDKLVCRKRSAEDAWALCWSPAELGDYCEHDNDCIDVAYCNRELSQCQARAGLGQSCDVALCQAGLHCRPRLGSWVLPGSAGSSDRMCYRTPGGITDGCDVTEDCYPYLRCAPVDAKLSSVELEPRQVKVCSSPVGRAAAHNEPCTGYDKVPGPRCGRFAACVPPADGYGLYRCSPHL